MNELIEFLLARITEDEEAARKLQRRAQETRAMLKDPWFLGRSVPGWHDWPDVEALAARALARCAADRRIVQMHAANSTAYPPRFDEFDPHSITVCASCGESREPFHKPGCTTLRLLALPSAEHPDFREEWAS